MVERRNEAYAESLATRFLNATVKTLAVGLCIGTLAYGLYSLQQITNQKKPSKIEQTVTNSYMP